MAQSDVLRSSYWPPQPAQMAYRLPIGLKRTHEEWETPVARDTWRGLPARFTFNSISPSTHTHTHTHTPIKRRGCYSISHLHFSLLNELLHIVFACLFERSFDCLPFILTSVTPNFAHVMLAHAWPLLVRTPKKIDNSVMHMSHRSSSSYPSALLSFLLVLFGLTEAYNRIGGELKV